MKVDRCEREFKSGVAKFFKFLVFEKFIKEEPEKSEIFTGYLVQEALELRHFFLFAEREEHT